ncbi:unnamed protein product, partial [Didymodactylos carnosus]
MKRKEKKNKIILDKNKTKTNDDNDHMKEEPDDIDDSNDPVDELLKDWL